MSFLIESGNDGNPNEIFLNEFIEFKDLNEIFLLAGAGIATSSWSSATIPPRRRAGRRSRSVPTYSSCANQPNNLWSHLCRQDLPVPASQIIYDRILNLQLCFWWRSVLTDFCLKFTFEHFWLKLCLNSASICLNSASILPQFASILPRLCLDSASICLNSASILPQFLTFFGRSLRRCAWSGWPSCPHFCDIFWVLTRKM